MKLNNRFSLDDDDDDDDDDGYYLIHQKIVTMTTKKTKPRSRRKTRRNNDFLNLRLIVFLFCLLILIDDFALSADTVVVAAAGGPSGPGGDDGKDSVVDDGVDIMNILQEDSDTQNSFYDKRKMRLNDVVDSTTTTTTTTTSHTTGLPETRVGDTFSIYISSSFNNNNNNDTSSNNNNSNNTVVFTMTSTKLIWTIHHPGATYLSIHFQHFYLTEEDNNNKNSNCSITIRDKDYHIRDVLTESYGRANGTFWAHHVRYDTMIIEYQCLVVVDGKPNAEKEAEAVLLVNTTRPSFLIDKYAAGFADITNHDHHRNRRDERHGRDLIICSNDDKLNAICWEEAYPEVYNKAKAVAKLLVQGTNVCTGFLVGPHNYLLTNWHCINTQLDAINTDFTFLYEAKSGSCSTGGVDDYVVIEDYVIYSGESLIKEDFEKDYSLVKLMGDPVSQHG